MLKKIMALEIDHTQIRLNTLRHSLQDEVEHRNRCRNPRSIEIANLKIERLEEEISNYQAELDKMMMAQAEALATFAIGNAEMMVAYQISYDDTWGTFKGDEPIDYIICADYDDAEEKITKLCEKYRGWLRYWVEVREKGAYKRLNDKKNEIEILEKKLVFLKQTRDE